MAVFEFLFCYNCYMKTINSMKRHSLKPKGKNIEIALELLELSLILKKSVKKAAKKK